MGEKPYQADLHSDTNYVTHAQSPRQARGPRPHARA